MYIYKQIVWKPDLMHFENRRGLCWRKGIWTSCWIHDLKVITMWMRWTVWYLQRLYALDNMLTIDQECVGYVFSLLDWPTLSTNRVIPQTLQELQIDNRVILQLKGTFHGGFDCLACNICHVWCILGGCMEVWMESIIYWFIEVLKWVWPSMNLTK